MFDHDSILMKTGVEPRFLEQIRQIISEFPEIKIAKIFGSRAEGHYSQGSDIDLVIDGEKVSGQSVSSLKQKFDASTIPYFIDVISMNLISDQSFLARIESNSIDLYQKTKF